MGLVGPDQGRRILVVEDEPLSAELVRVLLDDMGFEARLATSGSEAVSLARDEAFALILMDFFLPVLNGLEAAAIIRSESMSAASRHAPIIALTASDNPTNHKACLDAGMNDYLLKPLGLDMLRAMLLKWKVLDGPRHAETAAPKVSSTVNGFDPSRIASLRDAMEQADFNAVIAQAVSSLDNHLAAIDQEAGTPDIQRRVFHRVVSLSQDLGFVSLGRRARGLEEAIGAGGSMNHASREAFLVDGRAVVARLKTLASGN
jgi:CheY-like chemotaxis protein